MAAVRRLVPEVHSAIPAVLRAELSVLAVLCKRVALALAAERSGPEAASPRRADTWRRAVPRLPEVVCPWVAQPRAVHSQQAESRPRCGTAATGGAATGGSNVAGGTTATGGSKAVGGATAAAGATGIGTTPITIWMAGDSTMMNCTNSVCPCGYGRVGNMSRGPKAFGRVALVVTAERTLRLLTADTLAEEFGMQANV